MAKAATASTALAEASASANEKADRVADEKAAPFCKASDLAPIESGRWQVWQILSEHTFAEVCHPGYFRNRISQLRPHQVIEIQHVDRRFYAKLLIRAVDATAKAISTTVLEYRELANEPTVRPDYSKCRIEMRDGPEGKRAVVMYGKQLMGTFMSREQAATYLDEQQRLVA